MNIHTMNLSIAKSALPEKTAAYIARNIPTREITALQFLVGVICLLMKGKFMTRLLFLAAKNATLP